VLAHLLGLQFVLRHLAYRRGHIGNCGPERGVVEIELLLGSGKSEIHPSRLVGEDTAQGGRDTVARSVAIRPSELTVGDHRDDPVRVLVFEPVLDLLVHPLRACGGR
jgi:hypothetical protein